MIQEIKDAVKLNNLKNNRWFALSALPFCLLIFRPDKIWLAVMLFFAVGAAALALSVESVLRTFKKSDLLTKVISLAGAAGITFIGARKFIDNWSQLHSFNKVLTVITALISAAAGFYFLALFLCFAVIEIKTLSNELLRVKSLKEGLANIKSNLVLIISSFCFLFMNTSGMNISVNRDEIIALLAAFAVILLIFSQFNGVLRKLSGVHTAVKIYALISSVGICYYSKILFFNTYDSSGVVNKLCSIIHIDQVLFLSIVSYLIALLACIAVFTLVSLLINYVINRLKPVFQPIAKSEIIVYSLIILLSFALVYSAFVKSNAFWGTSLYYDIIYTSDSPILLNQNVYLRLFHPENDLRQPLFAVFSAPFIGFGYALSIPFSYINPAFTPMFMNFVQVVMLVAANLMLANMLKLNASGRICFMLISAFTYSNFLFTVMMEQYIAAYFWLIFAVFCFVEYKKIPVIPLSAAGGTLLISMALLPLSYSDEKHGKIRSFTLDMEKKAVGFLAFLLAFCRLDIFLNISTKTTQLSSFTGGEGLTGRLNQYTSFIASCIFAPDALIDTKKYAHISWQLSESCITQVNLVGILILVLCLISIIVNRKNIFTLISGAWLGVSLFLMCVVGWGSAENGMILYSLYFGWVVTVLVFQLITWISEKMKCKFFIPAASAVIIIAAVISNYQGVKGLLDFAFTHYPV